MSTHPSKAGSETPILTLQAAEAEARIGELAAILLDAVRTGASVNFMSGCTLADATAFWRNQLPGIASGERRLLVAERAGMIVGTVVLSFAQQPNQPHRAEIGKMLVHSGARRAGLGRRLLAAAEQAAREAGRSLLVLDTETGSAGESLYRGTGWTLAGSIPGYALTPDGRPASASIYYKDVGLAS